MGLIVGPTASGKSELAMAIARRQPVEIIVADSRQVYRGMDIGTEKPDAAARATVPHHLLDRVDPDEPFTLADWLFAARPLVGQIVARGRLPLVVGGTGLYTTALVDGYELSPQAPAAGIRQRLVEEMEAEGVAALAERLRRKAPRIAAATDLRNPRRVLRALERVIGSGERVPPVAVPYEGRVAILGVRRPRPVLQRRIAERSRRMFDGGLLGEVRGLLAAGYGPHLPPMTGHGYREAMRVVSGEWTAERAIEVTERHTRQYAKRQETWYRRDARIVWLDAGDAPAHDRSLVDQALGLLRRILQP